MQCNFYIHVSFLGAVKECDVIDIPPSTPHIRGSIISALPINIPNNEEPSTSITEGLNELTSHRELKVALRVSMSASHVMIFHSIYLVRLIIRWMMSNSIVYSILYSIL